MAKLRVLVAEDESIVRLDLVETLEGLGYEVVGQACDGIEAVQKAKSIAPDVVLIDIKMPNMDGLAAAREILASTEAAVVVLTAFSQRDLVDQACEIGTSAYLVKPYAEHDLIPAIELAVSRAAERKALAQEVQTLSDKLEARKVIDKAKGLLMDTYSMSEADAFRFVQQTAMKTRSTMTEVANRILTGALAPADQLVG